ncbi:MAG: toll/interleukin-1 receptor domain-containing protein [Novosphingobium sp.]
MSQVLLLSLDVDAARTEVILEALVEAGIDTWWQQLPAGGGVLPPNNIGQRVAEARCVILVWSKASVGSDATLFHDIAKSSLQAGNAICVRIDDPLPPPEMAGCTLYDMRGWRSKPAGWRKWFGGNLYMRDLVSGARYKIAGKDPPPASAPRTMLIRQTLAVVPAIGTVIYLIPAAIGLWNDLGMANRPSAEEQATWDKVETGSCDSLRRFLVNYPGGHYAAQAQARLDGRTQETQTSWEPAERRMPVYVAANLAKPSAHKPAAASIAQGNALAKAEETCTGLAEAGNAKLLGVDVGAGSEQCTVTDGGYVCSFDGHAICKLSEPRDVTVERCS